MAKKSAVEVERNKSNYFKCRLSVVSAAQVWCFDESRTSMAWGSNSMWLLQDQGLERQLLDFADLHKAQWLFNKSLPHCNQDP